MDTKKNTVAQKFLPFFEVLLFLSAAFYSIYVGVICGDFYLNFVIIIEGVFIVIMPSMVTKKKPPFILWVISALFMLFIPNIIDVKPNIYKAVVYRDGTIRVLDIGTTFVPPFSFKKIYAIPKSETLELMTTLNKNDYQKLISGKFKITLDIQITGNLDKIKLSDLDRVMEYIEYGIFGTCFNAFLYKDREEIKKEVLSGQEMHPATIFCGQFHPQSYQLIDNIVINWDGRLKITELKITSAL